MSDLRYYRDKKIPLAVRMEQAAADNLQSNELDTLMEDFATEVRNASARVRVLPTPTGFSIPAKEKHSIADALAPRS